MSHPPSPPTTQPTLIFIPGSWHSPTCYTKIITPLRDTYNLKCIAITLPSTQNNPKATFKDDIDTARTAILGETSQGRNVIVIAHSYGGMVGNSAIKVLTKNLTSTSTTTMNTNVHTKSSSTPDGHVVGLILIASGFTLTGLSFMAPFFGRPPPSWRIDKPSGYAVLTANTNELFYNDLPADEASYWSSQLTTQSLLSLFEGGEYAYSGWRDVQTWYIGTSLDRGLPVVVQRVAVGMARAMGGVVRHFELESSHSPFLSRPGEVVDVIVQAVREGGGAEGDNGLQGGSESKVRKRMSETAVVPVSVGLMAPGTWFKFGVSYLIGRALGKCWIGYSYLRTFWTRPKSD